MNITTLFKTFILYTTVLSRLTSIQASNLNLVDKRIKDVNLPQIVQNMQFCFQLILQHPFKIIHISTSFNKSLSYTILDTGSTILYSTARVNFGFATYIDQTNKYSYTSAQINTQFCINFKLYVTYSGVINTSTEWKNEWKIWSVGGGTLRGERRITPRQTCKVLSPPQIPHFPPGIDSSPPPRQTGE